MCQVLFYLKGIQMNRLLVLRHSSIFNINKAKVLLVPGETRYRNKSAFDQNQR